MDMDNDNDKDNNDDEENDNGSNNLFVVLGDFCLDFSLSNAPLRIKQLRGSHGRSGRRVRRTNSSRPEGLLT